MATNLTRKEKDILKMIKSNCHLASENYNKSMERYFHCINKRNKPLFNLEHTYEKIKLAARVIAGFSDLEDIMVISSRLIGQRPFVKFSTFTKCNVASSSRWTPGCFTNYQTKHFKEPKLILVCDPFSDWKPLKESSYVNIPTIALCNSHDSLKYVDIAIPVNTSCTESIAMVMWILAREILILKGKLTLEKDEDWEVMVDLFYHKELETKNKNKEEDKKVNKDKKEEENNNKEEEDENEQNWGENESDNN